MVVIKKFFPKLRPKDNDLSARWFIQTKVFDTEKAGYTFVRNYDPRLNRLPTVEARLSVVDEIIETVKKQLAENPHYFGSMEEYIESKKVVEIIEKPIIPFVEALIEALESKKKDLRPKSYQSIKSNINNLVGFMVENNLQIFSLQDALSFAATFKTNTTRNSNIANLRTLAREAELQPNPFEGVKKNKENKQGRSPFTKRQLETLKKVISVEFPMLWIACMLQYYCLIRNGNEMTNIKVGDVDIEREKITIYDNASKNKTTLPTKIPKAFLADLKEYIGDSEPGYYLLSKDKKPGMVQLDSDYLYRQLERYLKRLGMKTKRHSFYSFKTNGVAQLIYSRVPAKAIQRQGRWLRSEQVNAYTNQLSIDDFADFIDTVPTL